MHLNLSQLTLLMEQQSSYLCCQDQQDRIALVRYYTTDLKSDYLNLVLVPEIIFNWIHDFNESLLLPYYSLILNFYTLNCLIRQFFHRLLYRLSEIFFRNQLNPS